MAVEGIFRDDDVRSVLLAVKGGKVVESFQEGVDSDWDELKFPYDLPYLSWLHPVSDEEMLRITSGVRPKSLANDSTAPLRSFYIYRNHLTLL